MQVAVLGAGSTALANTGFRMRSSHGVCTWSAIELGRRALARVGRRAAHDIVNGTLTVAVAPSSKACSDAPWLGASGGPDEPLPSVIGDVPHGLVFFRSLGPPVEKVPISQALIRRAPGARDFTREARRVKRPGYGAVSSCVVTLAKSVNRF